MAEKSVAQEQPVAGRLAKVDRALRQGRTAEWIVERLNGVDARRALTDALQSAVDYVDPKGAASSFTITKKLKDGESPAGKFIEAETNYIYGKLGISREMRKAIKKGIKRDHFNTAQIHAIGLAEQHDARIWTTCVQQKWTREKAKQARTEMLNRLASVQQFMRELTGEGL